MVRQLEALEIGNELLKKHGLQEWKIQFNKSPNALAQCWYQQKVIAVSVYLLNSREEEEYKDTILHEIAHALVGPQVEKHGEVWLNKAKEIGCTGAITGKMHIDNARSVTPAEQKKKVHIAPLSKKCPVCDKLWVEVSRAKFGDKTFSKLECGHLVSNANIKEVSFDTWISKSGKKLFNYQVDGARFIEHSNGRCLIADEPGLGKTAQALSFLNFHGDIAFPCLWICKTTLKIQALKESLDWIGLEGIGIPQILSKSGFYVLPGTKLFIISQDLLRNVKREKLESLGIKTIVFDEVQHIKNPDSARTQQVRWLVNRADFFIALSGTPWKNRGSEYFSVLNMLSPERFPSYAHFKNHWVDIVYDKATGKYKEGGIRDIPRFKEYTKDIVIRRLRKDVLPDLPKINRQIRYVELEDIYGEAYEKAEGAVAEIIKDLILDGKESSIGFMATEMMKLKHITGLAKVDAQVEDAIEFLEDTEDWEKLTIFLHHIDVADDVQNKMNLWLSKNGYDDCLRIRGGMQPEARWDIEQEFKNNIKKRVLIASTLASGEGLNLQFCQNASMMERQWNAANEEQAELRFSRPLSVNDLPEYLKHLAAQENVSIRIPYLICANTIDEMLTHIVERKRVNFNKSMNEGDEGLEFSESSMIRELAEAIVKKRYGKAA